MDRNRKMQRCTDSKPFSFLKIRKIANKQELQIVQKVNNWEKEFSADSVTC
jgi:hypothetical protein